MNEELRAWPPRLPTLQREQPLPASLTHCLLLAVLLHVWGVLVLGNAPGGTAAPGQGVWGTLNVRLRGPVAEPETAAPPPPEVQAGGAPGQAAAERWGGAVREREAPAPEAPGAQKWGHWGPRPEPMAGPSASLAAPQSAQALPLPGLPALSDARPADARLSAAAPGTATAVAPLPAPVPLAAATLSTGPPPPGALPAPLRALQGLAAPAGRTAQPEPALQPSPIEQAALALGEIAAPGQEPVALPAPAATRVLRPVQPPGAQALATATEALAPAAPDAPAAQALPEIARPAGVEPALRPPASSAASLDAGARVGHDVATPASNAASTLPRLNLELARPRGGELSRGASRGLLPVLPRPPEVDDKLAREIEKAAREDCRKAYAASGLLAVVPLAADALGKSGSCKW